jgi:hypothetical protein
MNKGFGNVNYFSNARKGAPSCWCLFKRMDNARGEDIKKSKSEEQYATANNLFHQIQYKSKQVTCIRCICDRIDVYVYESIDEIGAEERKNNIQCSAFTHPEHGICGCCSSQAHMRVLVYIL